MKDKKASAGDGGDPAGLFDALLRLVSEAAAASVDEDVDDGFRALAQNVRRAAMRLVDMDGPLLDLELLPCVEHALDALQRRDRTALAAAAQSLTPPSSPADMASLRLTLRRTERAAREMRSAYEDSEGRLEEAITESERLKAKLLSWETAKSATHFQEEAKTQLRWTLIVAGIALAALAAAGLWAWLYPSGTPDDKWDAIRTYSTKGLVFALLLGVALGASKVVFALLHNTIVNRQRQNALNSFDGLYAGADKEHRSTIVENAARLIFSPIPTGLTKIRSSDLSVVGSTLDSAERTIKAAGKDRY